MDNDDFDFEIDPLDLAFALGISEEMADEEKERLGILKELEKDQDEFKDEFS